MPLTSLSRVTMTGGTSCHHLNGNEEEEELGFGDNKARRKKGHILQSTANKFACSFHFSPATVTAEGRVISNNWGQGFGGRFRLGEGDYDDEEDEIVFLHSGISGAMVGLGKGRVMMMMMLTTK